MDSQEMQEVATAPAPTPSPSKSTGKDLAKGAVIGFARIDCNKCFGRGRKGFDVRFSDNLHVIPCDCVEMLDLETLQKDLETLQKEWDKVKEGK
jgi:hypothetical protein